MEVHRGEVFYADLSPVVGSEQGGVRPVLIVQNEIGNRHSPTVIAAAITSRLDKTRLPTHINIRAADTGLAKDSVVLLEQIRTLDKHRLRQRAGQITPEDQKRVNQALDVSLGLDGYLKNKSCGIPPVKPAGGVFAVSDTAKNGNHYCGRRGAPRQSISELFSFAAASVASPKEMVSVPFFVVEGNQYFIVIEVNSINEGVNQRLPLFLLGQV